jgi:hypothetical protein
MVDALRLSTLQNLRRCRVDKARCSMSGTRHGGGARRIHQGSRDAAQIWNCCCAGPRLDGGGRQGRVDLTLKFNGRIWLFEFKVVELEPAGRALQQLKDRGYADKYQAAGQPIHLIGIEFSREQRGVIGFEVETL